MVRQDPVAVRVMNSIANAPSRNPLGSDAVERADGVQIPTLALWLTVVVVGLAGIVLRPDGVASARVEPSPSPLQLSDLVIGMESATTVGEAGGAEVVETPAIVETPVAAEPPELAPLTPMVPLPELPAAAVMRPPGTAEVQSQASANRRPAPPSGSAAKSGAAAAGATGAARLAAGRMPAPTYPAEARRRGQSGTVLVEFTIDASGQVISVVAKSPSPWPLLNQEALSTVRRWKFPPGNVITLQRPIVFQLR